VRSEGGVVGPGIALEGIGGPTPALVVGYANLTHAAVRPAVAALAASIREATSESGAAA
jgi:DNA-binding transcriptional MocR family regulator